MATTNFDVKALAQVAALAESLSPSDIRSIGKLIDYIADAPEGEIMIAESVPLVREGGTSTPAGSIDLVDGDWVFVFGTNEEDAPAAPAKTRAKAAPAAKAKPATRAVVAPKDETEPKEEEAADTPMALSESDEDKPVSKAAARRPAPTDDDDF